MYEDRDTLAYISDGSEDTLSAFMREDPTMLVRQVLMLGTVPPRIFDPVTKREGWDGRSRLWMEWSTSATDISMDIYPPGSWDFEEPGSPDSPAFPDSLAYWYLRISTDVRASALIEAKASLHVTAPALLLRIMALSGVLCVMESGRAPGRVNAATDLHDPGHAQVLIASSGGNMTRYVQLWDRAINFDEGAPKVIVQPVANLAALSPLTYAAHVGFQGKTAAETAPGDIARLLAGLAQEKLVDWEPS